MIGLSLSRERVRSASNVSYRRMTLFGFVERDRMWRLTMPSPASR